MTCDLWPSPLTPGRSFFSVLYLFVRPSFLHQAATSSSVCVSHIISIIGLTNDESHTNNNNNLLSLSPTCSLPGFNVNEISSFTFNNCQLPNIPFSVLLHRTRLAPPPPPPDQLIKPAGANQQLLKPSRSQKHQNLVRRRRQLSNLELRRQVRRSEALVESPVALLLPADNGADQLMASSGDDSAAGSAPSSEQPPPVAVGRNEPRVKALTINLQTVVDQRTLISLLTGLDYLEELQLNYMQLNLTSFEPADLEAESASGATGGSGEPTGDQSASSSPLQASTATSGAAGGHSQLLDTSSSTVSRHQTSSPAPPVALVLPLTSVTGSTPAGGAVSQQQQQVAQGSAGSRNPQVLLQPATSTTSTSTTSTTTTTTSTTVPPATQLLAASTGSTTPATPMAIIRTSMSPTTMQTAPATATTPTTLLASGSRTKPVKQQTSSALSGSQRPSSNSIQMGAPRGLMSAQATGVPLNPPTTTPTPAATTVPAVSLATVAQTVSRQSMASATTGSPPRAQQPQLISLGASGQSQVVSYAGAGTRPAQSSSSSAFQTQTLPSTTPTSSPRQVTTNGWMQSGSSSGTGSTPMLAGMRLRTEPATLLISEMTATSPSAQLSSGSAGSNQQLSVPPNSYGIRNTSPTASVPVSLQPSAGSRTSGGQTIMNQQQTGGGGGSGLGVGLRGLSGSSSTTSVSRTFAATNPATNTNTMTNGNPNMSPLSSASMTTHPQHQQTRRQNQQTATPTTNADIPQMGPQFVAAGGRIPHQQQLNPNMRRQFPTTTPSGPRGFSPLSSADETEPALHSSTGDASSPVFTAPQPDTVSFESSRRVRRHVAALEEFELSFGELLPNLRSLKLESFIDLSHLMPGQQQHPKDNHQVKPRTQHLRFRRQFQPNDVPEKDEGYMSESEHDAIAAAAGDSMLAEESSVHHNMVMANAPGSSQDPPLVLRQVASSRRGGADLEAAETGDLLMRAASGDDGWSVRGEHLSTEESSTAPPEQPLSRPMLRHLSYLLSKMFSRLTKLRLLQLTSNDIPHWPDNVLLDSRHSLTRLYLMSNNIRSMGRSSLANLTELETLDLSSNQLRQLNSDLFRDLSNLRNLRAVRNLFRKLPARLFSQRASGDSTQSRAANNKLTNVDFSKNRYLSQLSADLFAPLSQQHAHMIPVSSLNLSDCVFNDQLAGKTPEAFFASLPDLTSVSLKHNRLRELLTTSGLFAKNNRLAKLDVSHNQLNSLSANLFNANASQITDLQLHHNQLSQIPDQFLFSLRKLRRLSLSHNKLNQLNARMFFTNQLIESIDLSHNQLVTLNIQQSGMIPFGNGANLRQLNLAYNNLSQFEADIFDIAWSFYTSLTQLDLSHNHFEAQIAMPIFYTTADELQLNLANNLIQSISVEALMQHEQVLDRYATYEASENAGGAAAGSSQRQQAAASRLPTVSIRLTGNPIACDCMLEPLISYSRRVAAITNPTLVASIFSATPKSPATQHHQADSEGGPPVGSRYSVLDNAAPIAGGGASDQRLPQLFYQFKFNDLYCAQPTNLQRRLLGHISIGDLLCPIKDQRLCPRRCQCHYQSAFRTAIVDCNGRQLNEVPEQLTEPSNFVRFQVESSFGGQPGASNSSRAVSGVDKVIIRLDNNRLRSMEQLSRLFSVVSNESSDQTVSSSGELSAEASSSERARFARAPPVHKSMAGSGPQEAVPVAKKVVSPASAGRNNLRSSSLLGSNKLARSRRRVPMEELYGNGESPINNPSEFDLAAGTTLNTPLNSESPPGPVSTAVLESAEEFRSKRYPLACELYLDHNLIESIPANFLEMLDQVSLSAMQSTLTSPQSALPTLMLEPPHHTKLEHVPGSAVVAENRVSSTTTASSLDEVDAAGENSASNRLFGGGRAPLSAEKKAALMETINHNVRLNQQQPRNRPEAKVSVSPALAVLSLRYNNLSNIQAKLLQRFSKLTRSSNTKLYLGHNPFNCSDNYASGENLQPTTSPSPEAMLPASALGDQLVAASDSVSGAYLESTTDDLSSSASSLDGTSTVLAGGGQQPLTPVDCPIGQLKSWLTGHHASVGDLDEIYCVHMPPELAEKLRLAANASHLAESPPPPSERLKQVAPMSGDQSARVSNKWDHDHPWASSLMISSLSPAANGTAAGSTGGRQLTSWNSELLMASAKLIDANMYDLCPYSGIQLLDASASGLLSAAHQQVLVSVAIIFILISLCLLLMLVYFGDTQTILAFVYIHLNPVYKCLRLNESHLDGEKLYDAFVSYSSADRDIVMELIERLEQTDSLSASSRPPGYGATAERRNKALNGEETESGSTNNNRLSNNTSSSDQSAGADTTLSRRTSSSFQDLSTMSRSTSRIMMGADDYGGSALEMSRTTGNETGRNGAQIPYRLCIHERDWLPGHLISWNIVNSVQNSRRTILVLSKDFIKSVWFQVEFHTAYYQMLEDKIDRLIVIVRGELPPKNELDKNLAFLLTTKTYLTWGEKWFWERLHYALPHRAAPPALAPRLKQHHHHQQVSGNQQQQQQQRHHQHHHHFAPAKAINGQMQQTGGGKGANHHNSAHKQKPLIMSDIGKECANLLLPVHHHQAPAMIGSSSSSGSSNSNTRSSSSFLSGSSTGNLLSPAAPLTATTHNDLLSTSTAPPAASTGGAANQPPAATTRLTIGPDASGPAQTAGGSAGGGLAPPSSPTVTSIMVDAGTGAGVGSGTGGLAANGSNSKLRAKKQERLQSFVDKTISDHFNLSEL